MTKIRAFYGLLSSLTLISGMLIYLFFRNLNNMILFSWIQKPIFFKTTLVQLKTSIPTDILRYNLPDMLWFISGILFLRFIWFNNTKVQMIYIMSFLVISLGFEISQLSKRIPGTFDWLDLLFIGIGAFVESLLYKIFILRRSL